MRLLYLTWLSLALNFIGTNTVPEAFTVPSIISVSGTAVSPGAVTNILYQSKDGGQTWEDVSYSLPAAQLPEGFFAGESELYMRVNNVMYRSKSNLKAPVWEKVTGLDPKANTMAFNRSGVMAYQYEGQVYQQKSSSDNWVPAYTTFKKSTLRTIFETANGTLFIGRDTGLYKSTDRGHTWKRVQDEGWVMSLVEGDGVLIGTGTKGIMRSTDNGEHWDWVIREGGVGIAVERIEGGFAAISFNPATQSRRIHVSRDGGTTWQAIDAGLTPSLTLSSIKQVGGSFLCGHPDGIMRSSDQGKSWYRVLAGVDKNKVQISGLWNPNPPPDNRSVFALFVSGKIVYAVAQEGGC